MLYLDSRWSLCFTSTIAAGKYDITIFWVSFPVKGTCEGVFLTKVAGCFLTTAILPKMNFFCRAFLNFWQKVSTSHFFRCLLLFSLKLFSQKKSVLLKLTRLITLLPYPKIMYRGTINNILDQSNEINYTASCWALILKGICNTICSNGISLNVTLISTACHWIVGRKIKKHLRQERGEQIYGNEVISMLLPFSNNFSKDNYHI